MSAPNEQLNVLFDELVNAVRNNASTEELELLRNKFQNCDNTMLGDTNSDNRLW